MSQNCCAPVDTGQSEEVSLKTENCWVPILADNKGKAVATQTNRCVTCGQKGKKVDIITLKAMLDVSLLALCDGPYLFCATAACSTVYFAADGLQSYTKEQIRVRVYQKEPGDEAVLVCYCFYHSPATIRAELLATGGSTVVKEIAGGLKAGQCACEVRNPQGSCCLGNVRAVVKRVMNELGAPATSTL